MRAGRFLMTFLLTGVVVSLGPSAGAHYRPVQPIYGYRYVRVPRYYGPAYRPFTYGRVYGPAHRLTWPLHRSYSPVYCGFYGAYPSSRVYLDYAADEQAGYSYSNGAIRTDVEPKETEVYVDGQYAGIADDFDGSFERLYLPPGEHEIELRLEGYRSHREILVVSRSRTHKLSHRMTPRPPGENIPPPPAPRQEESPTAESDRPLEPPLRGRDVETERQAPREEPRRGEDRRPVAPGEFGLLSIRVQPSDADVVVDGELWGSLAGLEEVAIHLSAGPHRVEIRRDGYVTFGTEVDIRRGETTPLNVKLSPGQP